MCEWETGSKRYLQEGLAWIAARARLGRLDSMVGDGGDFEEGAVDTL